VTLISVCDLPPLHRSVAGLPKKQATSLIGYTRLAPRTNPTNLSTGFPQYLWKIQEETGKAIRRLSFPTNLQRMKNQWDFQANRLISPSRSVKRQGKHSIYPQASLPARQGILLPPVEKGRFPFLHTREYGGIEPINFVVFPPAWRSFCAPEIGSFLYVLGWGQLRFSSCP
jgi:hypothetical protein